MHPSKFFPIPQHNLAKEVVIEGDRSTWHIRLHQRIATPHGNVETWMLYNGEQPESSPTVKDGVVRWRDQELAKMKPYELRWTKPRADGQSHTWETPCECAHCSHEYPGFDMTAIILHCRDKHREFYRQKWDRKLNASMRAGSHFAPLP